MISFKQFLVHASADASKYDSTGPLVQEVFDKTYEYEVEEIDGDWMATFKDDTGHLVGFIAEGDPDIVKVHFKRKGTWDLTHDKEDKNIGIKIMGTVVKILKEFIRTQKPKSIMFSTKKIEDSRVSLYNRLVQREAEKAGYIDCTDQTERRVVPEEERIIKLTSNSKRAYGHEHGLTLLVRKDLTLPS